VLTIVFEVEFPTEGTLFKRRRPVLVACPKEIKLIASIGNMIPKPVKIILFIIVTFFVNDFLFD
jgi:hypothetical protein